MKRSCGGDGETPGSGYGGAPPITGSLLEASWGSCERVQGVRMARMWPAAWNFSGGELTGGRSRAEIQRG